MGRVSRVERRGKGKGLAKGFRKGGGGCLRDLPGSFRRGQECPRSLSTIDASGGRVVPQGAIFDLHQCSGIQLGNDLGKEDGIGQSAKGVRGFARLRLRAVCLRGLAECRAAVGGAEVAESAYAVGETGMANERSRQLSGEGAVRGGGAGGKPGEQLREESRCRIHDAASIGNRGRSRVWAAGRSGMGVLQGSTKPKGVCKPRAFRKSGHYRAMRRCWAPVREGKAITVGDSVVST